MHASRQENEYMISNSVTIRIKPCFMIFYSCRCTSSFLNCYVFWILTRRNGPLGWYAGLREPMRWLISLLASSQRDDGEARPSRSGLSITSRREYSERYCNVLCCSWVQTEMDLRFPSNHRVGIPSNCLRPFMRSQGAKNFLRDARQNVCWNK